jgi:hypothetical protein
MARWVNPYHSWEEPVLGSLERILRLRLGDPVEVRLSVLDPAFADGAREGDEGAVVVALLRSAGQGTWRSINGSAPSMSRLAMALSRSASSSGPTGGSTPSSICDRTAAITAACHSSPARRHLQKRGWPLRRHFQESQRRPVGGPLTLLPRPDRGTTHVQKLTKHRLGDIEGIPYLADPRRRWALRRAG